MTKKTAIDWFIEQMRLNCYISKKQLDNCDSWLTAEAKELEKEQIVQARITAPMTTGDWAADKEEAEQYYERTFQSGN
jgi:hypothetical protein